MSKLTATQTPSWPPALPLELALGIEDEADILLRHNLTVDDLNAFLCTPAFAAQVAHYRKDLHENGEVFRAKARVQAELLLDKSYALIHAVDTPANVKADLIKSTVEWAGLKPSGKVVPEGPAPFSITFNFPLPSGAPAPNVAVTRPKLTIDNV